MIGILRSIIFGLATGAILYYISIGFAFTFGTMRIINFAHTVAMVIGAYVLMTAVEMWNLRFGIGAVLAVLAVIPVAYVIERFAVRRLYGKSQDQALIATYAISYIVLDIVKWIWGVRSYPLASPIEGGIDILGMHYPWYRVVIVLGAILLFFVIQYVTNNTIAGKVILASLENPNHVRALGINVGKYYSGIFVLGSVLAALGGIFAAPIIAIQPYMGHHYILLCFAIVIVAGMGRIKETFYSAFSMGILMALAARFYPQAGEVVVYFAMAVVLIFRPIDVTE